MSLTKPPVIDPRRTLTLRDVSEASGVSEMTVSRVLRNRGDVSDATRERVLEAARSQGYVPNKIAGALASQRVNLVGVVIPSLSNMVFPEVMTGISETLEDTGLQPVVGVTNYSPEREESVIYEMLSWRPSGMIVAGLEHTDAARAYFGSQSGSSFFVASVFFGNFFERGSQHLGAHRMTTQTVFCASQFFIGQGGVTETNSGQGGNQHTIHDKVLQLKDQYKSNTAPLLAVDALCANLAWTPRLYRGAGAFHEARRAAGGAGLDCRCAERT